ncbi:MAG: hypothetical protein JXL84_15000 [Deltaproteobacteria bacterium]|nr:hypothetical protein [Deltaproteobacteria bacterium]
MAESQPWMIEMAEQLNRAETAGRRDVIEGYRELTGKSAATLYRIARDHGFLSGRRRRADAGRRAVTGEQVALVSAIIQSTAREVKGCIMDVDTALGLAEDNGLIGPGTVSTARMQALLRENNMNRAMLDIPEPRIRMRSLHPNHVHVLDASICIQYYLRGRKGLAIMDERKFYKNKPANFSKIKNKLIRYVLTDHFSHTIFVKYYYVAGENMETVYDFLCSAWRGGRHEKWPFRGVPFFLLMDAGAANIAKPIIGMLKQLDVQFPESMPHNPARQGSAEVAHDMVESKFESRLRIQPAATIEELNAWALDWCAWFNGTKKHRRHGMTRTGCWLKYAKQEHIRDLPSGEMMQELFAAPSETRTVDAHYCISYKSNTYRLKHVEGIIPRRSQVLVVFRPMQWPDVGVVFNETEYIVRPLGVFDGGFLEGSAVIGAEYKALPESPVQKVRKVNENMAYGESREKGAAPFSGTLQRVFGHMAEKLGNVAAMPRRGTPIEVGRDLAQKEIPIMELFKRLRDAGVAVTPALNAELREELGGSVSVGRAEEVVRALVEGADWRGEESLDRITGFTG